MPSRDEFFESLVLKYDKKIYNLAFRMLGNREDAADATQEAYLRAYSAFKSFRGDCSPMTWLYRIAANVCTDFLRKRRNKSVVYIDEPKHGEDGEYTLEIVDTSPGPEESAVRLELQAAVQAAISRLDDDRRLVVVLRDIQGLSYEEMAGVLGCSLGSVKSRLHRARQALREQLSKMELFEPGAVDRTERRVGR